MNPAVLVNGPATINVDLPPAALASPAAGVSSALSKRLLRWCPDLGGVLLSYGKLQLVGSHSDKGSGKKGTKEAANSAEISDYFGFVRVAAAVSDALVFAPTPGMRLEGTVARVGGDYVGLLALGVFSAAVGGVALSSRFELEEVAVEEEEEVKGEEEAKAATATATATGTEVEGGKKQKTTTTKTKKTKTVMKKAWVCKADKSHRLIEGARVLFDVARVRRSDGGFVSILGSLENASAGVVGARGVSAVAAPVVAAAAAPSAKKSAAKKSTPAAAAPAASSKRKKAEGESAEEKKKKEEEATKKEPKPKKAKTDAKKKR